MGCEVHHVSICFSSFFLKLVVSDGCFRSSSHKFTNDIHQNGAILICFHIFWPILPCLEIPNWIPMTCAQVPAGRRGPRCESLRHLFINVFNIKRVGSRSHSIHSKTVRVTGQGLMWSGIFLDHACTPETDRGAQTWQRLTLRRICAAIPLHVRAGITLLHTSLSLRKPLQLDVRSQHHWGITLVHFFHPLFCLWSPAHTDRVTTIPGFRSFGVWLEPSNMFNRTGEERPQLLPRTWLRGKGGLAGEHIKVLERNFCSSSLGFFWGLKDFKVAISLSLV